MAGGRIFVNVSVGAGLVSASAPETQKRHAGRNRRAFQKECFGSLEALALFSSGRFGGGRRWSGSGRSGLLGGGTARLRLRSVGGFGFGLQALEISEAAAAFLNFVKLLTHKKWFEFAKRVSQ